MSEKPDYEKKMSTEEVALFCKRIEILLKQRVLSMDCLLFGPLELAVTTEGIFIAQQLPFVRAELMKLAEEPPEIPESIPRAWWERLRAQYTTARDHWEAVKLTYIERGQTEHVTTADAEIDKCKDVLGAINRIEKEAEG